MRTLLSARSAPTVACHRCLSAHREAVSFLEACGFGWPRAPEGNFARDFVVRDLSDCVQLAEFVLGALHLLFGHESGGANESEGTCSRVSPSRADEFSTESRN